ncbi:MAG: ABC-type transport auxiliary lipoprotein family protein [Candidatus Electryonea clarkiae]|nr:ABC-type transport auxiliary lipoprotein family protein [Candidatus Electryonea clarkiae]MDP8286673.1 ABC-type transport auxiliary lipoprotein family protein [Candidatus Electryonea clarkiae]
MKISSSIILILVISLHLAGCLTIPRDTLEITRYSIDVPDSVVSGTSNSNITIVVAPFQANAELKSELIHYKNAKNKSNYYYYHRWLVSPENILEDLFTEYLVSWNSFEGVFQQPSGLIPDYEIHGRLVKFHANNIRGNYSAVLEIKLSLFKIDQIKYTKELKFQKTYSISIERKNNSVASFVEAANLAVKDWLIQARTDIESNI